MRGAFSFLSHKGSRAWEWINSALEQERERWVLWIPCALSAGIGFFFSMWGDPLAKIKWITAFCIAVGPCAALALRRKNASCAFHFLSWALLWSCVGFALCAARTHRINPSPLTQPIPARWVTGTVRSIDHPASKNRLFQRIVIDIEKAVDKKIPPRAMITIRTQCQPLYVGNKIRLKAALSPAQGAYLPTGYNHSIALFFKGIGSVGFAVSRPRVLSKAQSGLSNVRHQITRKIYEKMPRKTASLACGLITGDKAALPQNIREDFSQSGLSHLLAISGLHISALAGMAFFLCRFFLARWTALALSINIDRISGVLALALTGTYLVISGQSLSSIRAFSMSAASLVAMMVLRKRNAMRTLMLCAAAFLVLQPESLLSLSYQMSFVAVLGLLSFFENRYSTTKKGALQTLSKKGRRIQKRGQKWTLKNRIKRAIHNSAISTSVVTFSLSSITAFHFSSVSFQGLISNILAIPLTTFVLLPLGFVCMASLAAPWSSSLVFETWSRCLDILSSIAFFSSHHLKELSLWTPRCSLSWFVLQMAGLLWFLIWRRIWRFFGLGLWALAWLMGYALRCPSQILVDPSHRLVGYVDTAQKTLYLSSLRRGKWIAKKWSQAFCTPIIQPFSLSIPLKEYPGWNLSTHDEGLGMRVFFSHKQSEKSWSMYVPPFGPVWIASPLQKGIVSNNKKRID